MKTLLLALCLALASAVQGAPSLRPAPPNAVSLSVELIQQKSQTETELGRRQNGTVQASQTDSTAVRALAVSVKLHGDFDRRVLVRWGFVARSISGGKLSLYGRGSKEVEILPGGSQFEFVSDELTSSDHKVPRIAFRRTKGAKPHGFVVVVMQGDRVLASKESSAGLLALLDAPVKK